MARHSRLQRWLWIGLMALGVTMGWYVSVQLETFSPSGVQSDLED